MNRGICSSISLIFNVNLQSDLCPVIYFADGTRNIFPVNNFIVSMYDTRIKMPPLNFHGIHIYVMANTQFSVIKLISLWVWKRSPLLLIIRIYITNTDISTFLFPDYFTLHITTNWLKAQTYHAPMMSTVGRYWKLIVPCQGETPRCHNFREQEELSFFSPIETLGGLIWFRYPKIYLH